MGVAFINTTSSNSRVKKNVDTEHLWYDSKTGTMLKLTGGKLKFSYKDNQVIVGTEPLDVFSYEKTDSTKKALAWFNANKDELLLDLVNDGMGLEFSFPDNLTDDVDASLYQERFDYELRR